MALQIMTSKKGTQVVKSSSLFQALELPAHKYNSVIKKWLTDIYEFKDGIRQPEAFKDFAQRKMEHSKFKDYYLSLELAKRCALKCESPQKRLVAQELSDYLSNHEQQNVLDKNQIIAVLELTKVLGRASCQKSVEQQHMRVFESNGQYNHRWWKYRAQLLGYSVKELQEKMGEIGKSYQGKSLRQMLMFLDKYEIIRMAVIDLFIALGKSKAYSCTMGDLAKIFAKEMHIEIWDDTKGGMSFDQKQINPELLAEVQGFQKGGFLSQL